MCSLLCPRVYQSGVLWLAACSTRAIPIAFDGISLALLRTVRFTWLTISSGHIVSKASILIRGKGPAQSVLLEFDRRRQSYQPRVRWKT